MQAESCCDHNVQKWYKRPLYITLIITFAFILLALYVPILNPFLISFIKFWDTIWWAIIIGLLISGLISALIPTKYISHYLAQENKYSILNAAILGFIMSACSHGILAISMELYKKGASVASTVTFLMASPWANMSITLLLISLFGLKAFVFIIAALIIAIITGFIYSFLELKKVIAPNPYSIEVEANFSIIQDIKTRYHQYNWNINSIKQLLKTILSGSFESAHMVLWWIIIGTLIGSLLDAYIPHSLFHDYMSASFTGLIVTLLIATIIEVCSEGSAPIAFMLYKQTSAFGNAFAFLMAGVATDFTEIGLIWANIGKKPAVLLPIVTVPQILLFAYIFNQIF